MSNLFCLIYFLSFTVNPWCIPWWHHLSKYPGMPLHNQCPAVPVNGTNKTKIQFISTNNTTSSWPLFQSTRSVSSSIADYRKCPRTFSTATKNRSYISNKPGRKQVYNRHELKEQSVMTSVEGCHAEESKLNWQQLINPIRPGKEMITSQLC